LPAIVGIWAMCLSLFLVVRRRCPVSFAWASVFFALSTKACEYIWEGRPYGLWLGLTGLSYLAWQAAADGRNRPVAVVGLALSTAAATAAHYYAVPVLMILCLGELTRSWHRRRPDIPVWLALAAGLLPLPLLMPLIRSASRAFSGNFWSRPGWRDI